MPFKKANTIHLEALLKDPWNGPWRIVVIYKAILFIQKLLKIIVKNFPSFKKGLL
ncbi:hypothetical protein NEOC65_001511 [Neochlamydia sp. AcF65]|nr:hypothetical protein [Neochlamydia sp. AcF65]MBS4169340.1 hypothetical protein [Neochlamydia sp. AcF95]NGY95644.1 hypothetical protein [Neochlamydia sp. AcF84]